MSPIMIIPPCDHCPMPPSSGLLNCAWRPFPCASEPSNVSATSRLTPWRAATSVTIRRPSGVRLSIVGRIPRAVGEGEPLHGERQRRNNVYTWFARSASLGNRQEGPRVCLWTRRANRGVKLRETESDQSRAASYHPAQVNGQTLRDAQVFLGEFPRSTCRGRRYRPVPVARSDATSFGRKHDTMSSRTLRVVPHRPGTPRLARSLRAPIL